jgi:hypothetical protein
MSDLLLALLVFGVAASATALALDMGAESSPSPRSPSGRRSTTRNLITDTITVLAALSLIAALLCSAVTPPSPASEHEPSITGILTIALTLLLATLGGGPFAVLALRLATRGQMREGINGGILVAARGEAMPDSPAPAIQPRRGLFSRRNRASCPAGGTPANDDQLDRSAPRRHDHRLSGTHCSSGRHPRRISRRDRRHHRHQGRRPFQRTCGLRGEGAIHHRHPGELRLGVCLRTRGALTRPTRSRLPSSLAACEPRSADTARQSDLPE